MKEGEKGERERKGHQEQKCHSLFRDGNVCLGVPCS